MYGLDLISAYIDFPTADLARLLQEQQKEPVDLVWVSYYWKQVRLDCLLGFTKALAEYLADAASRAGHP